MEETEMNHDAFQNIRFHEDHGPVRVTTGKLNCCIVEILTDRSSWDKGDYVALSRDTLSKPKSRSTARRVEVLVAREVDV